MAAQTPPRQRKRLSNRSWLEAQDRLLSPGAILLRFVLAMACIAAIELGRKEGLAFAVALIWHGQCSQLIVMGRLRSHFLQPPEEQRIREGWLDVDWRLRGIVHHQLRLLTTALLAVAVLYFDERASILALIVCHLMTEGVGVVMGRIIDPLLQVEVERRVAEVRGLRPPEGADRGDYRRRGE